MEVSDVIRLSLASPDLIRQWSHGEVKVPKTLCLKDLKPVVDGLFCEKIFGPVKDYCCACGKCNRSVSDGGRCKICGVEICPASVRFERMGHVELAVPLVHPYFLKIISVLLDVSGDDLRCVVYGRSRIVLDPKETSLKKKQILDEGEYRSLEVSFGEESFVAKTGGEGLRELLCDMSLEDEVRGLQLRISGECSDSLKRKLSWRLALLNGMRCGGIRPEWMVLEVLPIIPPDLRPVVLLQNGTIAASDINTLYSRIIVRNDRLRRLKAMDAPDIIVCGEMVLLQESVDALFLGVNERSGLKLKSFSELLKGKAGLFRRNLLGKRVDYSGRTVIVAGAKLKLHQCGLPSAMALVLFEPFIVARLIELNLICSVVGARKMVKSGDSIVLDILAEVVDRYPVLLNRAPTLHRLSIRAFEVVLVEGSALQLHPLACKGFNADFDGDQMAVYVPLSAEAVMEAFLLMMPLRNLFLPSNGEQVMLPSHEMILGIYSLTLDAKPRPGKLRRVSIILDALEARRMKDEGILSLDDWVDMPNPDYRRKTKFGVSGDKYIRTTIGRVLFNSFFPKEIGFVNETVDKNRLSDMLNAACSLVDREAFGVLLDVCKEVGFLVATRSGVSVGMDDIATDDERLVIIEKAQRKVLTIESQQRRGLITSDECYKRVISIWGGVMEEVADILFKKLMQFRSSPSSMIFVSGARGNKQQLCQLAGMRGLMARADGRVIEYPILSSFRDGLGVLEYFISTYGGRKGMVYTALKTADSGYLTRKLCNVAMGCVIGNTGKSLDYSKGIWKRAIFDGNTELMSLPERIIGRCACESVVDPDFPGEYVIRRGEFITEAQASRLVKLNISAVKVLSPLTHMVGGRIPAEAYGEDRATRALVIDGTNVGVLAGQSVGEPGTQLTLSTFHEGGVASIGSRRVELCAQYDGTVRYDGLNVIVMSNKMVVLNGTGGVKIMSEGDCELQSHHIPVGAVMMVSDGDVVEKGTVLAVWDGSVLQILSGKRGKVRFKDILMGVSARFVRVEAWSAVEIMDSQGDLCPCVEVVDEDGALLERHELFQGFRLAVKEEDTVFPGTLIAKFVRASLKTRDIVGGLRRIVNLLEARRFERTAEMARIDGVVSVRRVSGSEKWLLRVENDKTKETDVHFVPSDRQVVVRDGEFVKKGCALTDGFVNLQEVFLILEETAAQEFLLSEIQRVYRTHGVVVDDKYLEVIIACMCSYVRVKESGDSRFFIGEIVERSTFLEESKKVIRLGGKQPESESLLLGISAAILESSAFFSVASFQWNCRFLAEAAAVGKRDNMSSLHANLLTGNLVPVGTGYPKYRNLSVKIVGESGAKTAKAA